MFKLIKKLGLGVCITGMLFNSTTAFAQEKEKIINTSTLVLEEITDNTIINPGETIIVPYSAIVDRPTINNGQTGYFNNGDTSTPFKLLANSKVSLNLRFNTVSAFKIGVISTNSLYEAQCLSSSNIFQGSYGVNDLRFKINNLGDYRVYLTNYGPSPLSIREFEMNLIH